MSHTMTSDRASAVKPQQCHQHVSDINKYIYIFLFSILKVYCVVSFYLSYRLYLSLGICRAAYQLVFSYLHSNPCIITLIRSIITPLLQGSFRNCSPPPSSPYSPELIRLIVPMSSVVPNRGYPVGCVPVHFPRKEYKQ